MDTKKKHKNSWTLLSQTVVLRTDWEREFDLIILAGPLQFKIFYDSVCV